MQTIVCLLPASSIISSHLSHSSSPRHFLVCRWKPCWEAVSDYHCLGASEVFISHALDPCTCLRWAVKINDKHNIYLRDCNHYPASLREIGFFPVKSEGRLIICFVRTGAGKFGQIPGAAAVWWNQRKLFFCNSYHVERNENRRRDEHQKLENKFMKS